MQLTHLRIPTVHYCQLHIPDCTYITYILPYGSISISTALFARKLGLCLPALQHVSDVYTVFLFEVLDKVAEAEVLPFFSVYKLGRYIGGVLKR